MTHKFHSASDASAFVMAGNAIITVSSAKTGARFTFRIVAPKHNYDDKIKPEQAKVHFVCLLTGPNNTSDYTYMGVLRHTVAGLAFQLTAKSRMTEDAPAMKAFRYFFMQVMVGNRLPTQ